MWILSAILSEEEMQELHLEIAFEMRVNWTVKTQDFKRGKTLKLQEVIIFQVLLFPLKCWNCLFVLCCSCFSCFLESFAVFLEFKLRDEVYKASDWATLTKNEYQIIL